MMTAKKALELLFQSTPSVGRTTNLVGLYGRAILISIHALRGEDDVFIVNFKTTRQRISIHALRGEDDHIPLIQYVCYT